MFITSGEKSICYVFGLSIFLSVRFQDPMPLNLMLVWGPPTPAGADPGIEPGLLEGGGCGSFC